MAGILNHPMTAGQALTGASAVPAAASTTGTDSGSGAGVSSSSDATISANDFLTLLVTEMQNQDPTADTDPNEYINQLVQVNSLEQLIDINQNLSTALGDSGGSSGDGAPSTQATTSTSSLTARSGVGATTPAQAAGHRAKPLSAAQSAAFTAPISSAPSAISQFAQAYGARSAPGNLSIPEEKLAAQRVGHALDGRSHTKLTAGGLSGAQ